MIGPVHARSTRGSCCYLLDAWVQPPSCFRGTHPCWPEQLPAHKVSMQAGVPAGVPQGLTCPHCSPCMHHQLPYYWVPHVTHSKHAGSQHWALMRAALSNARTQIRIHTYTFSPACAMTTRSVTGMGSELAQRRHIGVKKRRHKERDCLDQFLLLQAAAQKPQAGQPPTERQERREGAVHLIHKRGSIQAPKANS